MEGVNLWDWNGDCNGSAYTITNDRALGTPLDWPEAKKNADHVREWGIKVWRVLTLLLDGILTSKSNYFRSGTRQRASRRMRCSGVTRLVCRIQKVRQLLNFHQVEYLVVTYKDEEEKVTLSLRQADILQALAQDEKLCKEGGCVPDLQSVE